VLAVMVSRTESSADWKYELNDLLDGHKETLTNDLEFISHVFDPAASRSRCLSPGDRLETLIVEAEKTLRMVEPYLCPGTRILEIGGGIGLVYALLRTLGHDIVSLEPGGGDFRNRHKAGLHLLQLLRIDAGGWLGTGIEDFNPRDRHFDLIFSFFVLEHLSSLNRAFCVMAGALSQNGLMVHSCPNYTIPFEPHYNMLLVPFRPEWTALIHPVLNKKELWRNLCFTTARGITRLCARNGMQPLFRKGMMASAFERVMTDPVFAGRKQGFVKLARLLRVTGMLGLIRRLPAVLDTPMELTATRAQSVERSR